jgi:FHA domain
MGRDEAADIVLPEAEGHVSRRHLLFESHGLEWIVIDLESSHGTRLRTASSAWDLPPYVPVAVATGDRLILAGIAAISIVVVLEKPRGIPTKNASSLGSNDKRLDPKLAEFALELLKPRREQPGAVAVRSAEALADHFGVKQKTIYNWRDSLLAKDRVARNLEVSGRSPSLDEVADAVVAAYPYLKRLSRK